MSRHRKSRSTRPSAANLRRSESSLRLATDPPNSAEARRILRAETTPLIRSKPQSANSSESRTSGSGAAANGETVHPAMSRSTQAAGGRIRVPADGPCELAAVRAIGSSSRTPSPASMPMAEPKNIEAILLGALDKRRKIPLPEPARKSAQRQYSIESKRPLTCWLFVLPLILIYESVTLGLPGNAVRSGLDQWVSYFLSGLGLGQMVILPLIASVVLLRAHHLRRDPWQVSPTVLGWMGIESLGLGLILFWAANAVFLATYLNHEIATATGLTTTQWWQQTIALIGSGIYEEVVFRLIGLTLATELLFRWTGLSRAHWIAIALISLLFAALHYDFVNPAGSPFEWSGFLFRFLASVVFSVLFLFRGLGIAVGTHVAYDLLTQV